MSRRILLLVTMIAGGAALALAVANRCVASRPPLPGRTGSADGALPTLWPAPRFTLVDQAGRMRSSDELRGSVWIADFVFTHCSSVCPVVTAKMVQVQRAIRDPRVRFVSFSVDPDRDTPDALLEYGRRWAPDETRWTLFATTRHSLAEVVAGMKTWVQPQSDPDAELHTSELFLVDGQGRVRGLYDTADVSFARLVPHAQRLLSELDGPVPPAPATAAGPIGNGAALYRRLGCAGCHDAPSIAPSLAGIAGRTVMLAGGRTVTADAAYLRESVVEPAAKVVATYPAIMPSYRTQLSETELASLVQYLQSWSGLRGAASSASAGRGAAIDPVCGMQVHAGPGTPHLAHQGRTVYFCSDRCRDRFAAHPHEVSDARSGIGN
jgi:protein SCO1/2